VLASVILFVIPHGMRDAVAGAAVCFTASRGVRTRHTRGNTACRRRAEP
jgi:hypothetical protein